MKRRPVTDSSNPVAPWRPEIEPLPHRDTPYPPDRPLDYEEVKSALWHGKGNLRVAAGLIKTEPARLGALVRKDESLQSIRKEAAELVVDQAESVIIEALEDEDIIRKDHAAQFVLEKAGRGRGWTRDGSTGIGVDVVFAQDGKTSGAAVSVRWQVDSDV